MPTSNGFAVVASSRLIVSCLAVLIVLASGISASAQSFSVVVDFGNPGGRQPYGRLQEASDGCMYGTAVSGGKAHGTIYKMCAGVHTTLYMFSGTGDGSYPEAGLTLGSDGQFYGVTRLGASTNKGTIFKFNPATRALTTLHVFNGTNGAEPRAELTEGTDGRLYGVTASGGSANMGTVFSIGKTGGFTSLKSFSATTGRVPTGALFQASDGFWYGTASLGGASGLGTLWRMSSAGVMTTLLAFNGTNGSIPRAGLTRGVDGYLYGTTAAGGTANQGTVFRIDLAGRHTLLRSFTGANGANPSGELVQCADGWFYGTTTFGGANASGVLFKIDAAGNLAVMRSLTVSDGGRPEAGLIEAASGRMYGVTPVDGPAGASGTVFEVTTTGAFSRIMAFSGTPAVPYGPLVEAPDGSLYGTSFGGGSAGAGTIFRVTKAGSMTVLHSFSGLSDGLGPNDGVTRGSDGAFYTSAVEGGSNLVGVLGKWAGSGPFNLLATMSSGAGSVGYYPRGNPVEAPDGSFYGAMSSGGASTAGTIYRMTSTGAVSLQASFNGTTKGMTPYGRLALGKDGSFYGTTVSGGASFLGTLFSFNPATKALTVLHSFAGAEGSSPYSGVMQGSDGRLYGTTTGGGASGQGTIFAFDLGSRTLTRLYSFTTSTGGAPYGTLIEGPDGRLYGTASVGGGSNAGTVFSIQKTGAGFTVLHSFNKANGAFPRAGLVLASDGMLYGNTPAGGSTNNGVIFRLPTSGGSEPPPPPPSEKKITLTSPNGPSTIWTVATKPKMTWTSNFAATERIRIELSLDGGATYPILLFAGTPNDGRQGKLVQASWRTTRARVRVSLKTDAKVFDVSDADFVIK